MNLFVPQLAAILQLCDKLEKFWLPVHGVLLALHVIVGIIIARVPLTILCMVAYVITTLTQQMAFKRAAETTEKVEETEKKEASTKSNKKKNKK